MEKSDQEKFDKAFLVADDTSTLWDEKQLQDMLANAHSDWLLPQKNWSTLLTLTFKYDVSIDAAMKNFKRLIRYLNEDLFGRKYTKIVRHCYFSYVLGIEYQRRGVIHFHVIVDRPVNSDLINKLWHLWAGRCQIEEIRDPVKVMQYVCKCYRDGQGPEQYLAKKEYMPTVIPAWW